ITARVFTCQSTSVSAAAPSIENPIAFRRPIRSVSRPPKSCAANPPSPYIATARPACGAENPLRVRYSVMKGSTKVPRRFTNVPANRTHAAEGIVRTFSRRLEREPGIPFNLGGGGDTARVPVVGLGSRARRDVRGQERVCLGSPGTVSQGAPAGMCKQKERSASCTKPIGTHARHGTSSVIPHGLEAPGRRFTLPCPQSPTLGSKGRMEGGRPVDNEGETKEFTPLRGLFVGDLPTERFVGPAPHAGGAAVPSESPPHAGGAASPGQGGEWVVEAGAPVYEVPGQQTWLLFVTKGSAGNIEEIRIVDASTLRGEGS